MELKAAQPCPFFGGRSRIEIVDAVRVDGYHTTIQKGAASVMVAEGELRCLTE
jgi:hypothetical protein